MLGANQPPSGKFSEKPLVPEPQGGEMKVDFLSDPDTQRIALVVRFTKRPGKPDETVEWTNKTVEEMRTIVRDELVNAMSPHMSPGTAHDMRSELSTALNNIAGFFRKHQRQKQEND